MIEIESEKSAGGRRFICRGHAGYCCGNDIVCAAVSALCGTLVAALKLRRGRLERLNVFERSGLVRIECAGGAADEVFDTVLTGLRLIAKSYRGYVLLREKAESESERTVPVKT